MSKLITVAQAAKELKKADNILILTHAYPDGDTLGSGYALCRALHKMGKSARVECSDIIPDKYRFMFEDMGPAEDFEPEYLCAVDVADSLLLGDKLKTYAESVDLCIDHHGSNTRYAKKLVLIPEYSAAAMIVAEIINALGVKIDSGIAACIYTGIATDTGCFKYSNTTSYAMRMAADMLDYGINSEMINRTMFDIKSRARIELERMALGSMRFFLNDRCAIMLITHEMIEKSGAGEEDLEGLAPIPRQIEGVHVGVTMRERQDGTYKVSIRTDNRADASSICSILGGGGHVRAAGCTVGGPAERAVKTIVEAVRSVID